MSEENKKKGGFNVYWIYAIIAVSIIGIQLYMNGVNEIKFKSRQAFFELADSSYIQDVSIVNRQRVDFKLNEAGRNFVLNSGRPEYKEVKKILSAKGSGTGMSNPELQMDIADAGTFEEELNESNKSLKEKGKRQNI